MASTLLRVARVGGSHHQRLTTIATTAATRPLVAVVASSSPPSTPTPTAATPPPHQHHAHTHLHQPQIRSYVSRAHPTIRPSVPITTALQTLLSEIELRHLKRAERWSAQKDDRVAARAAYFAKRGGPSAPTPEDVRKDAEENPYRRMDESIELALQLNLDPRKPGQALRGSLPLPHGNGRNFAVAVFTSDEELAKAALENGAAVAGGDGLVEQIRDGTVPVSAFQRALASPEMVKRLAPVARILGPRGLMPNPKLNTIVEGREEMLEALATQMSGTSNYRTDRDGIVRLGVGRGSFGYDKLLDNVREFMNEIQSVKPESFGKGKKGQKKVAKGTKYYLKAHLSATQGRGSVLVDVRTLDPTSSFFMTDPI